MACLKPAMRVCSSLLSNTCVFLNGLTILLAISTSTSMCFYQSTKQGNPLKSFRAVGQTSGSLNPHKAALPPMIHVISEKTFKVSCEESLTSFYTSLKFLFLLSVSHKTEKTSVTSFTSTIEQKKPRDTTQQADTLSQ